MAEPGVASPSSSSAGASAAPPPATGGEGFNFDATVKRLGEGLLSDSARLRSEQAGVNAATKSDLARLPDISAVKPPPAPAIAPAPKPVERTPFETFGNIASVLGVLGGLATKRPLMAGLNASAAAMKAIKESDAGAFRQNFETWKAQSDYAYKLADFQNQQYRDVLENAKLSTDQILSRVKARAASLQDDVTLHLAESGDLQHLMSHVDARDQMAQSYKIAHDQLEAQGKHWEEEFAEKKREADRTLTAGLAEHGLKINADNTVSRDPSLPLGSNPKLQLLQQFRDEFEAKNGRKPTAEEEKQFQAAQPRSAPALYMQKLMEDINNLPPGQQARALSQGMAEYRALQAAEVGFGPTGKYGQNITAINTAVNHLDTWERLAHKASLGDVQAFNAFWNMLRNQISGDPQGLDAAMATQFVGPEIVKAIIATGGGVNERDELKSLLTTKLGPKQITGQANTAREFLAGRLEPIKFAYDQEVMQGSGPSDFFEQKFVTPRAREVFGKRMKEKDGAAPPDEAVKLLKDDPSPTNQAHFDEVFGAGSAAKLLGGAP